MKNNTKVARSIIPGSQRRPANGAKLAGKINLNERLEVTVRVRPRQKPTQSPEFTAMTAGSLRSRQPLTREEFADRFGADPSDLERIEHFAHEHGLDVVNSDVAQRTVRLSGTVKAMQRAFGVNLQLAQKNKTRFRQRTGAISIPSELAPIVEGVFGLDNRPYVRPHFHLKQASKGKQPRAASSRAFTPLEIAKLYDFPPQLDGSGQCIAILEFGGGYRQADLKQYFKSLNMPVPKVSAVSIDGGHNSPTGDPEGPDGEVMLDIEVAGAIAPKAKIAVYFAPNTDAGFLDALRAAVHDSLRKPSVISISWGGPESESTQQALQDYDAVCQEAALLGVTICCSAGDHGSDDTLQPSPKANVDFPAASPHVLACGGTSLEAMDGSISKEEVWNNRNGWATGGGISEVFPVPDWQANANILKSVNPGGKQGRGVPDVAGDADANSGYKIRVDGQDAVSGGTSAVAPLWAALVARLNQGLGKPVGFINPLLYKLPNSCFEDVILGDNRAFPSSKAYEAGPGWDACCGLGTPRGNSLLKALQNS